MDAVTTVSAKGQIVIPKDVRDRLRLTAGERLDVVERPDGILLRRRARSDQATFADVTANIRSIIRYDGPPVSLAQMNGAIADMWADGGPRYD